MATSPARGSYTDPATLRLQQQLFGSKTENSSFRATLRAAARERMLDGGSALASDPHSAMVGDELKTALRNAIGPDLTPALADQAAAQPGSDFTQGLVALSLAYRLAQEGGVTPTFLEAVDQIDQSIPRQSLTPEQKGLVELLLQATRTHAHGDLAIQFLNTIPHDL
jgi:hypothetical protein